MFIRVLAASCLALSLAIASGASAATIYQYTGNTYTVTIDNTPPAGTTYTTSMSVSGSFTTAVALAANMPLTDISASILLYSFDDGANTLTQSNSTLFGAFSVATDGGGNISLWQFTANSGPPLPSTGGPGDQRMLISSADTGVFQLDRGILQECTAVSGTSCGSVFSDLGQVSNSPGAWSIVPEPSTALLLGAGLIGIASGRGRRRS